MKAKKLIFILLLVVAGGKTKACNTCHTIGSPDIELVTKAGEKIQLDSQSAPSSNGPVSHFIPACTKDLFTGRVTCTIPEECVEILQKSRLISQIVANQDKPTLLSLVFKSSKRGAIIGAIVGTAVGVYLLGKSLYRVISELRKCSNCHQIPEKAIINYLTRHHEGKLSAAYSLPELLVGEYIKDAVASFSDRLINWLDHHSPFPRFNEYFCVILSGAIPWTIGGALVGTIAGPVFLAMNPHQAVSVVLKVATSLTHDCFCQGQEALGTMNNLWTKSLPLDSCSQGVP